MKKILNTGITHKKELYKYNNDQRIIENSYYSNDSLKRRILYWYDNKGNLSRELTYFDNEPSIDTEYEYNHIGNLIKKTENYVNEYVESVVELYKYDAKNRLILFTKEDDDTKEIILKNIYKDDLLIESYDNRDDNIHTIQFDKRGNDIYYYEYDSIRNIILKIEKTFNERDSLLTENHFDNELKPRTYRIVNTYNTDGFKTEELFYDQDSLYERKVYEYNKNKLTKAVLYRKGKEIAHYAYDKEMATPSTGSKPKNEATTDPYGESDEINHQEIYDSQGNLSQYKAIYKGGLEEEKYFYYDMKGNCIRKEYFENGKPTYVIERKITYYQ
ncbi:hypothetical protein [Capnocytophaga sp. G2]|uniref:hypothetical protein n=1 Tax=Capnocytophaga sp. G2 TaxID=3110695 RepID=UPI002B47CD17|nr:hypothetical protein [Capnocytophaga sp. G2]MEB3005683.1 hypothetical protein [Capnocytophaga sp. G2]